jgi:predicted Zn-dependent protease
VRGTARTAVRAICCALVCSLGAGTVGATAKSGGEYRLLKLDGYFVKWGGSTLGAGAHVSYAFVQEATTFPGARNCGELVPLDALTTRHGISQESLQEETEAAFQVWEAAANITFVRSDDPARADILIGAQARPLGRAFANIMYHAGSNDGVKIIDQALVCLNPHHRWKIGFDGDLNVYDLRYTLVHEIGHAIGLDHPGPSGQVMSFRYDELHTELQSGDFQGAQSLYGSSVSGLVAGGERPRETNAMYIEVHELSLRD